MRVGAFGFSGRSNIPCNINFFSGTGRTPKKKSKKTHQTPQLHVSTTIAIIVIFFVRDVSRVIDGRLISAEDGAPDDRAGGAPSRGRRGARRAPARAGNEGGGGARGEA